MRRSVQRPLGSPAELLGSSHKASERSYGNVDPPRSCHLGDVRTFVCPRLRAKPATTGGATAPQAAKTNLNTATAAELDKLPHIGPTRSKAIIEARTKAKFKDWDDFVARKVVPADAAAAMKDVVSF